MADLFHYRTLTSAINQIQPAPRLLYNLLLKNRVQTFPDERVEFDLYKKAVNIAPFVERTQPSEAINEEDYEHFEVKPPSIKLSDTLSYNRVWTERLPGDNPAGGIPSNVLRRKIGSKQKLFKDRIYNTIEYFASKILLNGSFSYSGKTTFEFDYQVPGTHKTTADWSNVDTSTPVTDIRQWKSLISKSTGFNPNIGFVHPDVANKLLNNESVLKQLDNRRVNAGNIDMSGEYLGRLAGIDLYEFNETVTDYTGSSYDLQGTTAKFVLTTTEAWRMLYAASFVENGPIEAEVFSNSWTVNDPRGRVISAESHPLPVLTHSNGIVIATITVA